MAIINGKVNGTAGSNYRFWIEYETSSNIAENKTIITRISVIAEKIKGTGYYNLGNTTVSLNIDGVDYGAVVSGYDFRKYARKVLVTRNNIEIPHNDDGNKKITISSSWNMDNSPYLTTAEASATFDLPFIPRKSYCNFEDFVVGNDIPVTISRASANFKHTLRLYVNGTLIQTVSNIDTNATITYNADNIYAVIPNSLEGIAKITCETFYNETSLGITETSRRAIINGSLVSPEFSNFAITEMNSIVYNLTGGNNFIKVFSNIKFTIDSENKAVPKKSASISKYIFTVGTKTAEELDSSGTIEKIINSVDGSSTNVTVVDSRGLKTSVSKIINLIDYLPPSITKLETQRENAVGTNVFLILNAKIYDGDFGNGENKITYFGYRIKNRAEDWGNQTWYEKTSEFNLKMNYYSGNISLDVSDNFKLYSDGTSAGFTLGQAYDVQIKISDGITTQVFNSIYGSAGITDGKVLNAHFKDENGEYHIGYNGMPSEDYNHNFHGSSRFNGEIIGANGGYITRFRGTINGGDNFNNYLTQGFYAVNGTSNISNAPVGGEIYGRLEVNVSNGSTHNNTNNQIWHTFYRTNGEIYQRRKINANNWTVWERIYKEYILYDNASGTTGTISLADSAANYTYIDIFYRGNSPGHSFVRVYSPNGKVVNLYDMFGVSQGTLLAQIGSKYVAISGTTITQDTGEVGWFINFDNNGTIASSGRQNSINIIRVVGYR